MAVKVTKKDNFAELRTLAEKANRTDLVEFIDHEVELLTKKASSKSQTKTQKENETVKNEILNALAEVGKAVTVSELMTASPKMSAFTNQKLSALLKQLVESGEVVKIADKKRSLFALAESAE